ncbi:EspA/EspE family type VII secretion system effector [Mycobacterium sp. Aquia_213]|uniref:EspA/EspE family type VII secretion system effector n=1 Tax=Mycobacterium sp. Aquia_213 TaxID=2991728 RepID=UPI00226E63C9|nr:EspA/EspE family type VII secretion system effector [Mycobacterium sp. Aquia_213]WAC93299.1 EspA/EspE family type VII secretion system effector [Mycobacterium sp. Aquia_213]
MSADALSAGLTSYRAIGQYRLSRNMSPEELEEVGANKDTTSLILKALTVVDIVELMTGFGPPCDGADFTAGSQQLTEISEQLKTALPDDGWQGDASDAYSQQVAALRTLAQAMAELDLQAADITKNQAEWVTHMRLAFGILKDLLMAAFAIEYAMKVGVPAPAGPALAATFATTVAVLGIGAASSFVLTLFYYSQENASKANDLIFKYQKLAPSATGTVSTESQVAVALKSTTPDFGEVSRKMTDVFSAVDVTTTTRPDAAPKQGTLTNADEPPRRRVLGVPDETTPSTPSCSVPPVASVAQMPGKAAQLNQSAGPRPIYPVPRTGQKAGLIEEPASADDVDGNGAARGSEGAERAPVEVAAVGRHADVPQGLERRAG